MQVGESQTLVATPRTAGGAAVTGRTIIWGSSAPAIAVVSNAGVVTGVAPGSASVTATADGRVASAAVTVVPVPVATVVVAPASATLATGEQLTLAATMRSASGTVLTGRSVTWSSETPAVATVSATVSTTVSATGVVTAVAPGTVAIRATSEGRSGSALLTVQPPPVASVTVTPAAATVAPGAVLNLVATTRDAAGNVLAGRAVTWSSSVPSVASVSPTGTVVVIAPGTATITATSEGRSGSALLTVRQTTAPVASVTVAPNPLLVAPGFTGTLAATLRDAAGTVLTGRTISWQSANQGVATVSASGVVTQVSDGMVTITATSEGISGSAQAGNRFPATGGSTTLSAAATSTTIFQVTVPAGTTALTVTLSGGTGDPDLYLYRPGVTTEAACESIAQGVAERCMLTPSSPGGLPSGVWTVLVYGYTAYDGVTLLVSVSGN